MRILPLFAAIVLSASVAVQAQQPTAPQAAQVQPQPGQAPQLAPGGYHHQESTTFNPAPAPQAVAPSWTPSAVAVPVVPVSPCMKITTYRPLPLRPWLSRREVSYVRPARLGYFYY